MSAAVQSTQVPSPEKIREVTREILERPEFTEPSRWSEIFLETLKAIKEWLDALGAWSQANPILARVLFVVALVILFACLAHLIYLALADVLPFGRKKDRTTPRSTRWEILQGAATNWHEALKVARDRLSEGNVRRAIWIAHRVLLGLLDEQGAIKFAGWKTNSHYLGECARNHPWYPTFAELTDLYENTVYASRSASADAADILLHRVAQLFSETGGGE
jgi:phage shock protein PspC (stress-responsive transcriptional regulator)